MLLQIHFALIFGILVNVSSGAPGHTCDPEERAAAEKSYSQCQKDAHDKLRKGEVDACEYLEDNVYQCGDIMEKCMNRKALDKIRENSVRVAYRTLAIEKTFDFTNCGILAKFGIDPNEEEEDAVDEVEDNDEEDDDDEAIDGECTPRQLQKAYKKFYKCKIISENDLNAKLTALPGEPGSKDRVEVAKLLCSHLQNTINVCFPSVRICSTSESTWLTTKKAFVDSIRGANDQELKLDLDKCKLE